MDVAAIQREVRRLPAKDRKKLTAWMVGEFPLRSVEQLMAKAERATKAGRFKPNPPTADNFPQGKTLDHVLSMAARLGLRK